MSTKVQTILGIDPGTTVMGYGIIACQQKKLQLISTGTIHLAKMGDHYDKLKRIFERVEYLIKEYQPQQVALEAPFYGQNVQSMLKLGRAQGSAMAAALTHHLPIYEYTPKKIKMAITGNGNASKQQVAGMTQNILQFQDQPSYHDATDALATALCHYYQGSQLTNHASKTDKKANSWAQFIKDNPDRTKSR